jgi:hypothetical protein
VHHLRLPAAESLLQLLAAQFPFRHRPGHRYTVAPAPYIRGDLPHQPGYRQNRETR